MPDILRVVCADCSGPLEPCPEILSVICSWCLALIREGTPGALISHGLCRACEQRLLEEGA